MKKIAVASSLLVLSLALSALVTSGARADTDKPQTSVTGTIVKLTSDDMVLQTDQGELRFDMDSKTDKPTALAVGNKITVWYDSNDNPKHELDARKIEMFTEAAPPPAPTTQAPPVQESTPPPAQPTPPQEEMQTTQTTQSQETPLPKTASPLPLMGAVGLLSILGGGWLIKQPK
jgi:hypothetical protein